jgi:Ca2+-binding RTX toxin-like protein
MREARQPWSNPQRSRARRGADAWQKGVDMIRRTLALLVFGVALLVPVQAASAVVTISYDGDVLVYSGDDGPNDPVMGTRPNSVDPQVLDAQFNWANVALDQLPATCAQSGEWIVCDLFTAGVRLEGNGGNDYLTASDVPTDTPVFMHGGEGHDTLTDYSDTNATLAGDNGNDQLSGSGGNDTLRGGPANDTLRGGAGSDTVSGDDGDDVLSGDDIGKGPGTDVIDGGPGFDKVDDDWYDVFATAPPSVSVSIDGAANDGRPGENDNVVGVEEINAHVTGTYTGTPGNDVFTAFGTYGGGPTRLFGNEGADSLTGLDHVEEIDGGPGDDRIVGGYDNDTISGGSGGDAIFADVASNTCDIFSCRLPFGNDVVNARDGNVDTVDCGVGTDTAVVDGIDVVANCEKVDRAGPAVQPTDQRHSSVRKRVPQLRVAGSKRARRLASRGLPVQVTCPAACRIRASLRLRGKRIGSASTRLRRAGTARITVKITKNARRRVSRLRRGTLALRVTVTNSAGDTTVLRRAVRVRR